VETTLKDCLAYLFSPGKQKISENGDECDENIREISIAATKDNLEFRERLTLYILIDLMQSFSPENAQKTVAAMRKIVKELRKETLKLKRINQLV